MDTHYGYAPVYAPTQPPEHRQSFTSPSSTLSSSGPNSSAYSTTLPPLSSNYALQYPHGSQTSQSAYTTSSVTSSTQHGSYLAYASPAASQYNGETTQTQTPRQFPFNQSYTSLGLHAPLNQAYTSPDALPGRLHDLRPMPVGGVHDSGSGPSIPRSSSHPSLTQLSASDDNEPTHVVGSQGRRGVLPGANGRPVAVADAADAKAAAAGLKKDPNDGKWPCEHCNKRYLHAKHLKRHLLRHTGTRPYSCGLCRDTFSRSDILKRHFSKCSLRRGNPSGANHLTHSRAAKKAKLESEQEQDGAQYAANTSFYSESASHSVDLSSLNGLGHLPNLSNPELGHQSYSDTQRLQSSLHSRANSVKGSNKMASTIPKGSHTAPTSATLDGPGFPYSGGQATPDSLTTSGAATPFNYSNEPRSNQLSPHTSIHQSMHGLSLDLNTINRSLSNTNYANGALPHIVEHSQDRSGDIDWSLHQLDSNDDYPNSHFPSGSGSQHPHIKAEPQYPTSVYSIPHRYPSYQLAKH